MKRTYLDDFLLDVDEACAEHVLLERVGDSGRLSESGSGFIDQVLPLHNVGGARHAVVVAFDPGLRLLKLDPAAGLCVRVALLAQLAPVVDGARQRADVDEVEALSFVVHPIALGVIDVELDVGRHPAGLYGREVGAKHIGAWVLVAKVYGPDAGACPNVQHALWGSGYGSVVQLAVQHHQEDVVEQVEAVLLLVVVGQHVGAAAIAMVATAV